jgi:hypothetical protein
LHFPLTPRYYRIVYEVDFGAVLASEEAAQLKREVSMANLGTPPAERELTTQVEQLLSMRDLNLSKLGGPARRLRRNASRLAGDLGQSLSFAQQQLVMRASMLAVLLEDQECRALLGQQIALGDYTQMISVQKQILQALGLKRVPKDVMSFTELRRLDLLEQQQRGEPAS